MKRNGSVLILNSLITKNIAEFDNYIKQSKELERKTSELDARKTQLDTFHADTISKLENQSFRLKYENEQLKKQVTLLKK